MPYIILCAKRVLLHCKMFATSTFGNLLYLTYCCTDEENFSAISLCLKLRITKSVAIDTRLSIHVYFIFRNMFALMIRIITIYTL